jgi:excisionase family DNA binding protein
MPGLNGVDRTADRLLELFVDRLASQIAELVARRLAERPPEPTPRRAANGGDILLGVKEVAEQLGVSPVTAKKLIQTGEISAVRIGDRVLVRDSALQRYVKSL